MRSPSDRAVTQALSDERGDEELMLAFREGEAAAFEVLVLRHRRPLFNFLLRSVHNKSRAEELLQEVFLRVVRAKARYQRTAKFTTWVYTIARNLCVDESRRQKFRRTQSLEQRRGRDGGGLSILDQSAADQPGVDQMAQAPTLRRRMQAAVSLLPDEQREVFLMRQISGLSFKEIGAAVGAPENTVKSRMRYALEKLRQELADVDPRAEAQADEVKKEGANG
jgi:RNA polymerase sigma-70 factor (ECF subfamily)